MNMQLKPALLRWAREHSGFTQERLAHKLNVRQERVAEWERTGEISFPKLQTLAASTHTPIGYLFLPQPPDEELPIPDFRTIGSAPPGRLSVDLLDVIHQCQLRQTWYREYRISEGAQPLDFVGSAADADDPIAVAEAIRATLAIDEAHMRLAVDNEDAFRQFVERCENADLLVMRSGIVGGNTHRALDLSEFRGFALVDPYAPLVFINGKDAPAARCFTLAHELAHIWLGQSGVSNSDMQFMASQDVERFCNRVAVDVLIPMRLFREHWQQNSDPIVEVRRIAEQWKVSAVVVLRRAWDAGYISDAAYRELYPLFAGTPAKSAGGGGNYYASAAARAGKRFVAAVVERAFAGDMTYTEAFRLLDVRSVDALRRLGTQVGANSKYCHAE